MKNLRDATKGILKRVEDISGKSVQFLPDEKLPLLASLQIARHGADFHVLRYRPSDAELDYTIAFQAGFVLRLFANDPASRYDILPSDQAAKQVEVLLSTGQPLGATEHSALPLFSERVARWALMSLRSIPVGMRIDNWIATELPELGEMQSASIALQQQQNMDVLSRSIGRLTVPTNLLGTLAAYALFADRLAGTRSYAIPFQAAGLLAHGEELLAVWDNLPPGPKNDRELVDVWASASGMSGWFRWTPYKP